MDVRGHGAIVTGVLSRDIHDHGAVESLYGPMIVDIYKFDVREIAGDTVSVFMIFAAGSRQGSRTSQIDELVVQLRWRDGAFEFVGHRRP